MEILFSNTCQTFGTSTTVKWLVSGVIASLPMQYKEVGSQMPIIGPVRWQ